MPGKEGLLHMKKLGFGAMRLPLNIDGTTVDAELLKQMVDQFLAKGFTYFDTSYVYHGGESEKILKEVLVDRYPRSSFTITTKSPVFLLNSRERFFEIFEEQLKRLGTDYLDYYWLHSVNGEMYQKVEDLNLMDALIRLKQEGRARHIGLSYHDSPELLDQILTEHPELEYVQLQLNYFDWDSPYVAARDCYEVCKKHRKLVVAMEPVKGGALARLPEALEWNLRSCSPSLSTASWAIRFAASLDHVFMVLSGMSDLAQVEENVSYMEHFHPLSSEETEVIKGVAHALRQNMSYDPQSLSAAEAACPKHIGLVKIAQMLNDHQKMNGYTNTCIYYTSYLGTAGKAADCDKCGKCLPLAGGQDAVGMLETAQRTITRF